RQLVESDPAAAARLLEELGRDAREALEGVRELAYEIYPPLLLDRGLADALHAAAAQVETPCRVEAEGLDRYAPEVEAAAYFCCVEALRVAGAPATLSAREAGGALVFEVVSGGETDAADAQGLVAAADRIAALGGRLTVSSEPGRGARISGSIPVEP